MKSCLFASLLLFSLLSYGQAYKPDSLFRVFQNDIEVEQAYNEGVVRFDDDTRENYYLLIRNSPIDTLVKYMDNSDPAIRCFIFSGLLNKNASEELLQEIISNHANDTARFTSRSADLASNWTVREYLDVTFKHRKSEEVSYDESIERIRQSPRLVLPAERHGRIKKDDLLQVDSLFYNRAEIEVVSFLLTITTNSELLQMSSDSKLLTPAMKSALEEVTPGSEIYFEDLKVLGPDGSIRSMGAVRLGIDQ